MTRQEELAAAAYDIAEAYRAGQWPDLARKEWKTVWIFLVTELRRRCPGFTKAEYDEALNEGFSDSR